MTHWGYALLVVFVVLGLLPLGKQKARHLTLLVTVAALAYAFHHYGGLH